MINLTYIEGIFFSKWLSKFINKFLHVGNKFKVEKIIYYSFFFLKKNLNFAGLFFFFEVLEKIKPSIGLKVYKIGRKKAKKSKAIPVFLHLGLQYKKALAWLSISIILRKENQIFLKIYNEFYTVLIQETGGSLKKKKRVLQIYNFI